MKATGASARELALVPGWGLGAAAWQPILATLAPALAARWRVHGVELPASNPSLADAAAELVATLPAGIVLCGWSLGAQLALQAATDFPERVGGLILVAATPRFTQAPDWPSAQAPEVLARFAAALADDAPATLRRFIALLDQGDEKARALNRELNATLDAAPPAAPAAPAALQAGLAWLAGTDLRAAINAGGATNTPTLLIHGDQDALTPLAAAKWLAARLPQARLEIFAGAAHAPFLNDRERFVGLVADFCYGLH